MRRLVNRLALGLTGLCLSAAAAAILLTATGISVPGHRISLLPAGPSSPVLTPTAQDHLLAQRSWDHPLPLAAAATGAVLVVLLLAQLLSRTPARLRLHDGGLSTRSLTQAVRTRALLVTGIDDALVRITRGRAPTLELTARLTGHITADDAVDSLLPVLTDAVDSTGLPFRLRLVLTTAKAGRARRSTFAPRVR